MRAENQPEQGRPQPPREQVLPAVPPSLPDIPPSWTPTTEPVDRSGHGVGSHLHADAEQGLTAEPPPAAEIVDVAALEEQKRERRRQQLREAQRRWRENHPDEYKQQQQAYRHSPQGREHSRVASRRWYWRQKGVELPPTD